MAQSAGEELLALKRAMSAGPAARLVIGQTTVPRGAITGTTVGAALVEEIAGIVAEVDPLLDVSSDAAVAAPVTVKDTMDAPRNSAKAAALSVMKKATSSVTVLRLVEAVVVVALWVAAMTTVIGLTTEGHPQEAARQAIAEVTEADVCAHLRDVITTRDRRKTGDLSTRLSLSAMVGTAVVATVNATTAVNVIETLLPAQTKRRQIS